MDEKPSRLRDRRVGVTGRYIHLRPGGKDFSVRAVRAGETSAAATWSWTIVEPSGRKALILPTTGRKATFRAACELSRRCIARVTVKAGRRILALGRYLVPAHSSRRVAIGLTRAGRESLARQRSVRAKLTIVDARTRKRETLPVILRRR